MMPESLSMENKQAIQTDIKFFNFNKLHFLYILCHIFGHKGGRL